MLFSISTETAPFYAYLIHIHKIKNPRKVVLYRDLSINEAERQGFEPRVPRSTTVFKTAAIDHSATSPKLLYQKCFPLKAVQRYESFLNLQTFL